MKGRVKKMGEWEEEKKRLNKKNGGIMVKKSQQN